MSPNSCSDKGETMKTYSMASADFGFVMLGIVMIILVCVLPLVHQESLMYLESAKTRNQSDPTAPEARETMLVELRFSANGNVVYSVTSKEGGRMVRHAKEQVIGLIRKYRPQDVRLRVDRRIPYGLAQEIQLAVQHIGGRIWLVSERI